MYWLLNLSNDVISFLNDDVMETVTYTGHKPIHANDDEMHLVIFN